MANPGVGNKFVSVNLNKSYGQQQYHQHHHNNQHHSSSYGSNRNRPGGVGGGMVVLSRPRSSQKAAGPKLSVPPPLNLPSLRKEHERFDSLGSGGGPAGGGIGSGPRPGSSGTGWTKPATIAILDKEVFGIGGDHTVDGTGSSHTVDQGMPVNGVSRGSGNSVYTLPSARSVVPAVSVPSRGSQVTEKVTVLRGEDFPSLHAALPAASGPEKKQKDGLNQKQKDGLNRKQKQVVGEELANERNSYQLTTLVDMRPQLQLRSNIDNRLQENGEILGWVGRVMPEKDQMRENSFSGPLPLVRLNPRSDWADDERDTGLGLADRGRDHGFSRSEAYCDMDFDFPRPSILPQKPGNNLFYRRGQRDNETGRISSSEVTKVDTYGHDVRMSSLEGREGISRRASSPLSIDGFGVQEAGNEKSGVGIKPSTLNREVTKENKYIPSTFRDNARDDAGRRDSGYGQGGRQPWNNKMDSFGNRLPESNAQERHGSEQYNRYRRDTYQSNSISKSPFSSGDKKLPINDPILNFGRDKRSFARSDKPYLEDPFIKEFGTAGFDGRDPFSGGLVGLVKKKKGVLKQTDFHDPVRESFEAELERVQKMQEQERQRIMEEHERAMELARREEEERMRVAREQEERQRRLEEERQEAMRRAEEERLEAVRRAEEQRIAREEEKQRILLEEERRKQAAKQKLLELEERIAKRHADGATGFSTNSSGVADDNLSGMVSEKDISKVVDMGDWEDSERMVDRITTSASSDSSGMNRPFEVVSRPHFPRDGASVYLDRGKSVNSWKRDLLENGNSSTFHSQDQGNGHRSPRRDTSIGGRTFLRKEFYGGPGFIPSRVYHRGGVSDTHMEDFSQIKGQRWNTPGEGDHYGRNAEFECEFHDNLSERFDDAGWGHGRSRGSLYPPYHERMYQNPEADGLYSFPRSRYSLRQPRVLPPPTNSMLRNSYRADNDCPGPSSFSEGEMQYAHGARNESSVQTRYDTSHQENVRRTVRIDKQQENADNEVRELDRNTARCDSQSSLSVSSPPDSPVHLSHDDLDESRDSPTLSGSEGKKISLLEQGNEYTTLPFGAEKDNMMSGSTHVSTSDEEEWTIQNDQQLQEQEEYDEDEDGYDEEDEVHDGEAEDIDLAQDFDVLHVEEKDSTEMMDNLVLGFNEGVEVGMPNDEFEKCSRTEETKFVIQQISAEEQGFFDGMHMDGQSHQPVDGSAQVGVDNTSRIFQEIEKGMQDLEIEPKNAPQTSSELMDHVDGSTSSCMSTQPHIPSSSGQTVLSSGPSVLGQPEVPVKLPFGLFSGPSLIPSPVPAIQIGSIQMPLHLHASVGPSIAQVRPSQPPLFQFGQLRYTSPISQGILPLGPQSMCFVQPSVPTNFPLNQNVGAHLPIQPGQETSAHNLMKCDILSVSMDNKPGLLPRNLDVSHGVASKEGNSVSTRESSDSNIKLLLGRGELSQLNDSNSRPESGCQLEDAFVKNVEALSTEELESQPQTVATSLQSVSKEKAIGISRVRGLTSGGRGKRYVFAVKNQGSKTSLQDSKNSRQESSGFHRPRRQRTEFRVRESADRRQSTGFVPSLPYGLDDKSNNSGRGSGAKNVSRRVVVPNRPPKQTFESEGLNLQSASSQEVDSGSKPEKGAGKETLRKNQNISHHGEDVDAPLQSGIVRVFEQPGIEAPSDDDDFIEVRSKRQMLNDRREQREKEIKAKSRVSKMPRKLRSTSQSSVASVTSNKVSVSVCAEANSICTDYVGTDEHGLANGEDSAGNSAPVVSQPLLPIGFPAVKTDAQADFRYQTIKSFQTSSIPGNVKNLATGLMFENKNNVLDNAQTSLGSWGNSQINQQVVALTQNQLDEALKPAQFDTHSSVGDPSKSVGESSLPSSSILAKDKSFASAASPINSLLAGEKIQFGAVTSPTILPPSSRAVSHGMGPPGPCRSDIQISLNLSAAEDDCSLFFEKEKRSDGCESSHLVDCEAEAAASAVAVAAIGSDEIVGNRLGSGPISASDSKGLGGGDINGITAGLSSDRHLVNQSRGDESLSAALPADLSVETPPISLWPPLPSPQNSSGQMISHVPGGPASHFPFYEMNPMLGGPIFAFGPQDEPASSQSQPQKSSAPVSGPAGSWQHHSGVDSFYGPPAGFTGPFISPPGGIPGVQGPPHMVVYNHFAPVGQFGQVGLSFMGTTYIPSGKQPDWKHNPAASPMGVSEGDVTTLNMVSAQRNATNLPTPMQHLAPGSPLLPMASPLAMFDVSPFQSSPDMSRWSHVPASPLQSVSVSTPSQQLAEGALPSQFSHGKAVDQQLINRFPESQRTKPTDNTQNFPTATDARVTRLPDALRLVESSRSSNAGTSTQSTVAKSLSAGNISDASKTDAVQNGSGSTSSSSQSTSSAFKMQPSHQRSTSAQNYSNSSGYNYQRGGISQKNSSGGEWSHRRVGYQGRNQSLGSVPTQGRNQSLGSEKSFPSKMKQIYVAKQTASGTPMAS
ncbi:uncharacterized protein LOC110627596 [Manihot esculenta]|uniref:Uncharacterized protein n=2 Tax=Manihot esculenta TaxID=3983 RepID=A0ACB7GRM4_MANES|nr:uncharacterized protein LOC110627596 [Manihot esculenta]XP_043804633.1 uncharacterized protein LOC110627596 [Manihot esculenta]KAG8642616.1 hypothetical protein MANES_12G101200v8 [Manihot esculenta]KAG8642617.1 hypothetical protein MANES_12G101200v8 [Manihot esculenta]